MKDYIVFSISTHKTLAKDFAKFWNCQLGKVQLDKYADGEVWVRPLTDVKDKDVILIESTEKKPNDHIGQILMLLDALNRGQTKSITLIIPYLSYCRQSRTEAKNDPLSSQVFAKVLETAQYTRLLSFDLHHPDVTKFFTRGVKNLQTTEIFLNYYNNYFYENNINKKDVVIVAQDHGANARADSLAFSIRGAKRAILSKVKQEDGKPEKLELSCDVTGKTCIIIDDFILTGNTIAKAAKLLYKKGAKTVLACATHGLFTKDSVETIKKSGVKDIVVSNTVEQDSKLGVNVVDILPIIIQNI